MKQKLIGPFTQLLPMTGIAIKGAVKDEELVVIENGGIIVENNTVVAVGLYKDLLKQIDIKNTLLEEVIGNNVCMPGFIDSHTHICYGGSRANDYAMRNAGKTYLEISKAGGGIWDTVTQTRKASILELEEGITKRANKHLKNGVTTIEVKSGYGLSVYEELKMLRAIKNVNNKIKADLISTCLAAHMHPKDYSGTATEYLEEISISLFPLLKEERLTTRIDAFIEEGAFTAEVIAPYFKKAKEMGFTITVHADQFSTGGSKVAVDFNAISADHLEASTAEEIHILAKSNVIATALPGASIGLGCAFTPARKLLDAGGSVAIASDHNPGSAPMGDLLTQASILGTFQKLSNAEVLSGITFRAAAALDLKDRGTLENGFMADFIAFPTANYKEILYQQGQLKPSMVWKKGSKIA
ncbi:imidazolonepropionase [Cellulophaga omnivescoria]|uniref:imidazolonepropionase n=1 Tax=Cellulophaga omnivescoria TaxID=1888890 RepID=UPI0022F0141F|nr:imidazolonepropionase [Cellulophaga omnivescoria]WBU90225.1 imidazolonepropionase [Cellulophaga omnivescoria]